MKLKHAPRAADNDMSSTGPGTTPNPDESVISKTADGTGQDQPKSDPDFKSETDATAISK